MSALEKIEVFDEVMDFLASGPTSEEIIAYRPSDALQKRASELLQRNREGNTSAEENRELDEITELENFMTLLKAKARVKLAGKAS